MSESWSIRGISSWRRKAVVTASRQARMSVGEFITRAIDRALAAADAPETLVTRLDDLDARVQALEAQARIIHQP